MSDFGDIDSSDYLVSMIEVIGNFVLAHVDEITFTPEIPMLDENTRLTKPMLYIEPIGGRNSDVGMGRRISASSRAVRKHVDMFLYWIISDDAGGEHRLMQSSGELEYVFAKYRHELRGSGFSEINLSPMHKIPRGTTQFYGGRHFLNATFLIKY